MTEEDRQEMILQRMETLEEEAEELAMRTREIHSSIWRFFRTPKPEKASS